MLKKSVVLFGLAGDFLDETQVRDELINFLGRECDAGA